MTDIRLNTDDIFFEIVRLLDNATVHISARADSAIDHTHGILSAGQAWILAEMTLRNLDSRHETDQERFRDARTQARHLVHRFWANFKLFPLSTPDGRTAMARVVDDVAEKGQYVMASRPASTDKAATAPKQTATPAPAATNGANGNGAPIAYKLKGKTVSRRKHNLTDLEIMTIKNHFKNRHVTQAECRNLAERLSCSTHTIYNIAKGHSHADVR